MKIKELIKKLQELDPEKSIGYSDAEQDLIREIEYIDLVQSDDDTLGEDIDYYIC